MSDVDENARLVNGTLPHDPEEDAEEMSAPSAAWEPAIPFSDGSRSPFPVDALPPVLAAFVRAEAEATQTPPDLAGTLVLAVAAASLAKKARILLKPGWTEPLNLFVAVVLPPAERKSAVFSDVTAPMEAFEKDLVERVKPQIAEAMGRRTLLEERYKQALRVAAKSPTADDGGARELKKELDENSVPESPRLIADDVTPEKLGSLLAAHGGVMAILSAEGGIFDTIAGRYSASGTANLDVFLKAHNGENVRVDRLGRPSELLQHPALTLGLAIQPEVLRSLVSKKTFRGRGLLGRFLYSLPTSRVGLRNTAAASAPEGVMLDYADRVRAMLALKRAPDTAPLLRLSEGAASAHEAFCRDLEPRLHPDRGDLAGIGDWAGKLAGAVARLAGVLHCAQHACSGCPWATLVSMETMNSAIVLGRYFEAHALAAFGEMAQGGSNDEAQAALRWLQRRGPVAGNFSVRDVQRGVPFATAEQATRSVRTLEERGYARVVVPQASTGRLGRPPAPTFEPNVAMLRVAASTNRH